MHNYGDHRDTQRRYMHRAAPLRPEGFESRIFAEGERHDPAEGWTHDPAHAVALGEAVTWNKVGKAKQPASKVELEYESPTVYGGGDVTMNHELLSKLKADEASEDESEEIPFEAQLAALKRPALFKLAQELNVAFETGWTAAELRRAILNRE